jgi:hypothetical protein
MDATISRTVASVRRHVVLDDDADLSWLDQSDDEMGEGFEAHAKERKEAFERGDWCMVGVFVTLHDDKGAEITRSAGLWQIESDSGESHFANVADEEIAQLEAEYDIDLSGFEIAEQEA